MRQLFRRERLVGAQVSAVPGRRAVVLCNPAAGGGRAGRALPAVGVALRDAGLPHRVVLTTSLEHAAEEAAAAAEAGEVVAALGGDGLTGRIADAVSRAGGVLGVLPAGRGNDFARAIGLPQDAVAAARVLACGTPVACDIGEATDASGGVRRFLGVVSAGIDGEVARRAASSRLPLGKYTYTVGALQVLARWRAVAVTVEVDGRSTRMRGYTAAVANSGVYGGGKRLAPDARLDDGLLDVVLISEASRLRLLWALARASKGAHVRAAYVEVSVGREVVMTSTDPGAAPLIAYADGELAGPLPLRVRCVPAGLRVLRPPPPARADARRAR